MRAVILRCISRRLLKGGGPVVSSVRLFGEFDYAAKSWPQAHRVVLKAEVLARNNGLPAKDNRR